MTGHAAKAPANRADLRVVVSAATLCLAAGCAYENILALGAVAITYASAPDSIPSPSGSFGLDIEWSDLFGVSSYLTGGEALVMFQVAPGLGLTRSALVKCEEARDTFSALRFVAGWWSWPDAPGGSGALAGCRLAFGVRPYDPSGRAETFLFEYGFLWLFEVDGSDTAQLQIVRAAYLCGF